ncbi:MAG TPA: glycosyltransferase [Blastocatellia bacterium]|nr:glycosyltransferase [Blastocatellia bacterium]
MAILLENDLAKARHNDGADRAVGGHLRKAARPRVLHFITSFDVGGTERQAVELLNHLAGERFDVRLAVIRKGGSLFTQVADRFPRVYEFPLTRFYDVNALRQLLRLRTILITERINILHAHDFYSAFIGTIAARLTSAHVIACQRHIKLSDRRAHRWGERVIRRLAHSVLVNSDAIRDHIAANDPSSLEKVRVIKNGFGATQHSLEARPATAPDSSRKQAHDQLCLELKIDCDAKLVGCVASLRPVKGHRYLIEAAARVLESRNDVHFLFVGDGPLRQELEGLSESMGVAANIHFLGERADAALLFSAFDLAVLASLHEGLPNTVIEAMAAESPVVATAVGGVVELIADGETGYLVPPGDSDALARRIAMVLADPGRSTSVARRARDFVRVNFGVGRMVESVEKLYEEVMEYR